MSKFKAESTADLEFDFPETLNWMELYPKSLEMQLGDKGAKPHELSLLSDWGPRVRSTTLQFQG